MYIRSSFGSWPLTYLKVRLRTDAKTHPTSCDCLVYGTEAHALRRRVPGAIVFQTTPTAETLAARRPVSSTQQSVQYCRGDLSLGVSYCPEYWSHRVDTVAQTQRCVSLPHRLGELSDANNITTFSPSHGLRSALPLSAPARQAACGHVCETQTLLDDDLRSGLHRPRLVRQTGDGPRGVQSPQAWQTIRSSVALFQRAYQRLLARRTARKGHAYSRRNALVVGSRLCQSPLPGQTHNHPSRQGFYDHSTIKYLESHKAFFAIVAKLTQPLKRKLASVFYKTYASGIETGELWYQPTTWKKAYRFVVVRRPLPEDAPEQFSLFSLGHYSYQVIVTNLKLTPLNAWRFYNGRAAIELTIKELKSNYPLAKIPTKHFAANEAYFHILLFSYNLINWFKRLCLPKDHQTMKLNTLRSRLLVIPGELIRSGNRPTLKLPSSFVYKNDFEYATKKIDKFKI